MCIVALQSVHVGLNQRDILQFYLSVSLSEIVNPPMCMVDFAGNGVVFTCGTTKAPTVTWKVNGVCFSRNDPPLIVL